MSGGVFDLRTAEDMLHKLRLEVETFKANETARNAINAVWTGYHLREWIWNERLHGDNARRLRMGVRTEEDLNITINREHPEFRIVRMLANGAKHFRREAADPTTGVHHGAFDASAFSKAFDIDHLWVEHDGRRIDVEVMLDGLLAFWESFFATHLR